MHTWKLKNAYVRLFSSYIQLPTNLIKHNALSNPDVELCDRLISGYRDGRCRLPTNP